jgi:hypothetical protein
LSWSTQELLEGISLDRTGEVVGPVRNGVAMEPGQDVGQVLIGRGGLPVQGALGYLRFRAHEIGAHKADWNWLTYLLLHDPVSSGERNGSLLSTERPVL